MSDFDKDGRCLDRIIRGIAVGLTGSQAIQEAMARELIARRASAAAFADTVDAAARAFRARGAGGQQVPFHGDFCNITPSMLHRLEWWARYLTESKESK